MTGIAPGIVTDVGAVADAVTETQKTAGKVIDATEAAKDRQAGVDAAAKEGQAATLEEIELAKRLQVAGQSTTADPTDIEWAKRVHDRFTRPD